MEQDQVYYLVTHQEVMLIMKEKLLDKVKVMNKKIMKKMELTLIKKKKVDQAHVKFKMLNH